MDPLSSNLCCSRVNHTMIMIIDSRTVEMPVLLKLIYRVNEISIRILAGIVKPILKYIWNAMDIEELKQSWKKQGERFIICDGTVLTVNQVLP